MNTDKDSLSPNYLQPLMLSLFLKNARIVTNIKLPKGDILVRLGSWGALTSISLLGSFGGNEVILTLRAHSADRETGEAAAVVPVNIVRIEA